MRLTLNENRVCQIVLGAAHLANLLLPIVPDKYKALVTGILAILNWYIAEVAHKSMPDGTKIP